MAKRETRKVKERALAARQIKGRTNKGKKQLCVAAA